MAGAFYIDMYMNAVDTGQLWLEAKSGNGAAGSLPRRHGTQARRSPQLGGKSQGVPQPPVILNLRGCCLHGRAE
jgi:hypothetical protein